MILPLIFGISGLLAGIALSFIAPEELKAGWKYFKAGKFSLYVILVGLVSYSFWTMHEFLGLGLFAVVAIILFIVNLKFKYKGVELFNYALFTIPYFFQSSSHQLLIASVLFLYGLPAGTLLGDTNYEAEK